MNTGPPEWLTLDFLDQCIWSKDRFHGMTVTRFTVEPAVPVENNYSSYILRVKARLHGHVGASRKSHSLSLIIKCPLDRGTVNQLFDRIYENEPAFYKEFLPLGYQQLKRSFTAEHFHSPIREVVVLQDLEDTGFVMADKLKLLDLEHCRLYVEAAANFHAMSFAVLKQDPELINRIGKEQLFSTDLNQGTITANKNMIKYCFESFANHVPEFLESGRVRRVVEKCSTVMWDLLVDALVPTGTFNTLNQGDPWLTNMMFKRDKKGRVQDIKLLDFQCLRYASPISDLIVFLWSSANFNVLQHHQHVLYALYLESLNSALQEMELEEQFSMETVKEHVARLSPLALWAVVVCRPMIMKTSFADMFSMFAQCQEEYESCNNPYEVLYTERFCESHLPRLVECLDNSGVFDYIGSTLDKCDR